jgi:hypothetical protein
MIIPNSFFLAVQPFHPTLNITVPVAGCASDQDRVYGEHMLSAAPP